MKTLLPIPKSIEGNDGTYTSCFSHFVLTCDQAVSDTADVEMMARELWSDEPEILHGTGKGGFPLAVHWGLPEHPAAENERVYHDQGYVLEISGDAAVLYGETLRGWLYGLVTLKKLVECRKQGVTLPVIRVVDWPSLEVRSVSNTFAWYAGYGRLGFDMQLWGLAEWKEYLKSCVEMHINQFNMCMYGYWPFELPEYPETVLKGYPIPVWNKESENWVVMSYQHPNLSNEFLAELIEYGHCLGVQFFAYIGLNSYNGGYPSEHRDKRMKLPEGSRFVNDFDTLCLSNEETKEYLKTSIRRIVSLGFDGIDFEESEEAYWFCTCKDCKETYGDTAESPAEAKHRANYDLLRMLYWEIKEVRPDCVVGIRAWREPPLEKELEYLQHMASSIPEDVVLFWAPGLYTPEEEFQKWVRAFGPERIWARDTESNAVSSCFGRLIRVFRNHGLRCDQENNDQFIEEDIRQHQESVRNQVKGINGYMFEWYGFFLHLWVHGAYGWGCDLPADEFYPYACKAVLGDDIGLRLWNVYQNIFTIHESQMSIFPMEFPFARNKVERQDVDRIEKAKRELPGYIEELEEIIKEVKRSDTLRSFLPHLKKIMVTLLRNREIYDLALASVKFDEAEHEEDKRKYAWEMWEANERNFAIIREHYLDVWPVSKTGTKSCMIPYHEMKRVLGNFLFREQKDEQPIYLGVEALGWLWL